jgi:membrane protein DedA with SNARE-associated domain
VIRPPVEDILLSLQSLNPLLMLSAVFAIAFIENLVPPFPSDVVVVFAGSLVALGDMGFVETVLAATAGSTAGFLVMYKVGDWFGDRFLDTGRIPFIPVPRVKKVELWFGKYGFWLIVANRFLAGTRAVVSFFAGMSELDLRKTTALSFVSSLCWNIILVSAGYSLGRNWQSISGYLTVYTRIVTGILILILLIWIAFIVIRKRSAPEEP